MGALPNLIIPGFQKCGTSSLHRYLDKHPEISMSRHKEPDFFRTDRNWDRGVDWYRSLFDADAPVRGESSVNYTALPNSDGVATRMAGLIPDVRLIFCVRDPVERTISAAQHMARLGHEPAPLAEAVLDHDRSFFQRSRYAFQMAPFRDAFPAGQILVVEQRDLLERRRETLRMIFEWLGVDPSFDSPRFDELWEVSAGKGRRYSMMLRASRAIGDKDFWGRIPKPVRRLGEKVALGRRGAAPGALPEVPDEVRERLRAELAPEYDEIAPLISRP